MQPIDRTAVAMMTASLSPRVTPYTFEERRRAKQLMHIENQFILLNLLKLALQ
jgi:hypothetical protein